MKPQKNKSQSSALSQRALLVHLNISQWAGRKSDKNATATVVKAYKTTTEAGSYTKKLLPGATELEAVGTIATQIRKFFYDQTLPWMADGTRIISAKNHLKFAAEIRKMTGEFESAVKDFEKAYPRLQLEAQKKLGNLYSADEYPGHAEITTKFKAEVSYLPMPDVKDFRVDVSDAEKRAFAEKMKETETAAMRSVSERIYIVVKNAAEKLKDSEAIFRDSLLENIRELCGLLPALNISDDPNLEAARVDLEKILGGHSADSLRNDKKVRASAAKKLQDVQDKMGVFMGSTK